MLQLLWVLLGLIVMITLMNVDYSKIMGLALPFLGLCVLMLLYVLVMGQLVKGAQRWILIGPINIQPSELAKIAVILVLGYLLATREDDAEDFSLVVRSLVYMGIPAGLVLLQPDMGTPVLLFLVWLSMLFVLGAKILHLGAIALAFVVIFSAAWSFDLIRPHQKKRLVAFMDPETNKRAEGWQTHQSLIAIGSGKLLGKGIFKGTQTQLSFVPDQETDFIFTAIGEETGFFGSIFVLGLFGALLWRGIAIAAAAKDTTGRLIATGITCMFLVHIMINVGMATGLLPVKGMPLPFVSYGGSNMLINMMAVGLLESIHIHRHKIAF